MRRLKFNILLLFALISIIVKSFVGFGVYAHIRRCNKPTILVKVFSKRKQEFVDDSDYDIVAVQKRLHDPTIPSLVLFSFLLTGLLSALKFFEQTVTTGVLATIRLNLSPQPRRYLVTRKFII